MLRCQEDDTHARVPSRSRHQAVNLQPSLPGVPQSREDQLTAVGVHSTAQSAAAPGPINPALDLGHCQLLTVSLLVIFIHKTNRGHPPVDRR